MSATEFVKMFIFPFFVVGVLSKIVAELIIRALKI